MRLAFDSRYPQSHPLRKLAEIIAKYDCKQAQQACFFSAIPPPYNFLANGETSGYSPLPQINCPLDIAHWRFAGRAINCCLDRGFNDDPAKPSALGLSILFDPLVDAVLAANTGILSGRPRNPAENTLIVLTDYGAAYDPDINLVGFSGTDWGEDETCKVLCPPLPGGRISPKQVSKTLVNLWDCLCGSPAWRTYQPVPGVPGPIEDAIWKHNIIIWNFIPFLRGSGNSMNNEALPSGKCLQWVQMCLKWLGDLIGFVRPTQIVWCTQFPVRVLALAQLGVTCSPQKAGPPARVTTTFGAKSIPVHLLHHPCSWKGPSSTHWKYFKSVI